MQDEPTREQWVELSREQRILVGSSFEERGRIGEKLWKATFKKNDMPYISLSNIREGGAPLMRGPNPQILTDFELSTHRANVLFDSKAKFRSVYYRNESETRHGIDFTNYKHYQSISEYQRKKCCLGIIEYFHEDGQMWSGSILAQTLVALGTPDRGFNSQEHMVYWPRDRFLILAEEIDPEDFVELLNGGSPEAFYFPEALGALVGKREEKQPNLF